MSLIGWVDRVVDALRSAESIDGANAAIQRLSDRMSRVPGLPAYVHPTLVWIPVVAWGASKIADLARRPRAAQRLVAVGVVTAIPTMISGHEDWTRARPELQRVASVHAALNNLAVGSYTASWLARRAGRYQAGVVLNLTGGYLLLAAVVLGRRMNRRSDGPGIRTR